MISTLAAFVPVAALLVVAPGPDVLLVVRNAMSSRPAGFATVVGTLCGLVVHTSAAVLGLSTLVAVSATAFTVVKLVGAAYLVVLGMQALWVTRRRQGRHDETADESTPPDAAGLDVRRALRQGFLTNLFNPKVAVFFVALLPQFVPAGAPVAVTTVLLAGVFVAMGAGYLLLLVMVTVRAASALARPTVRRWVDRVTSTVLIGLGVRLATTSR